VSLDLLSIQAARGIGILLDAGVNINRVAFYPKSYPILMISGSRK
jgi:hypothetical protein